MVDGEAWLVTKEYIGIEYIGIDLSTQLRLIVIILVLHMVPVP